MPKSEVYSWRVSPELKDRLMRAAHARNSSLAELLDEITTAWLLQQQDPDEERQQRALQEAARSFVGRLAGNDPHRAEQASERVKQKLRERRRARRG